MRRAAFLLVLVAAGCNRTIDKDECEKMVGKMVDLLAQEEKNDDKSDKIKPRVKSSALASIEATCVKKVTKSQYDCVMAAKKFEEAAACDAK